MLVGMPAKHELPRSVMMTEQDLAYYVKQYATSKVATITSPISHCMLIVSRRLELV